LGGSEKIFAALAACDVEALRRALADGEDPNGRLDRAPFCSALQEAVDQLDYDGSVDLVRVLIESGADPNLFDPRSYNSPLLMAISGEHAAAAVLLLDSGADPNFRNGEGTPLLAALRNGDHALLRKLLDAGATRSIDESMGFAWSTPLGHAARRLDVEAIRIFLAAGADPERLDLDRFTARDHIPQDAPAEIRAEIEALLTRR
jgi:hypothetical protein